MAANWRFLVRSASSASSPTLLLFGTNRNAEIWKRIDRVAPTKDANMESRMFTHNAESFFPRTNDARESRNLGLLVSRFWSYQYKAELYGIERYLWFLQTPLEMFVGRWQQCSPFMATTKMQGAWMYYRAKNPVYSERNSVTSWTMT